MESSPSSFTREFPGTARRDDLPAAFGDRPEREGLPPGYRMRADSHYVDQLDARPAGPVVRMLATRQIEALDLAPAVTAALAQSVAAHGVLQPLLVHRSGSKYQVIAGRSRLAAAMLAGVTEVPCIVHDVDAEGAAALREAANLAPAATPAAAPVVDEAPLRECLQALANDVAGIGALAAFYTPARAGAFHRHATADLLQAQVVRAEWLAAAAALHAGPYREGSTRRIGVILDQLKSRLEPEGRVTNLSLQFVVDPDAARLEADDQLGAAIAGLIFMTASWLRDRDERRVEIRVGVPVSHTVKIEVVQRFAPPPVHAARWFEDGGDAPESDITTNVAARTARAFAAYHGGSLELSSIPSRGSVLQISFPIAGA